DNTQYGDFYIQNGTARQNRMRCKTYRNGLGLLSTSNGANVFLGDYDVGGSGGVERDAFKWIFEEKYNGCDQICNDCLNNKRHNDCDEGHLEIWSRVGEGTAWRSVEVSSQNDDDQETN